MEIADGTPMLPSTVSDTFRRQVAKSGLPQMRLWTHPGADINDSRALLEIMDSDEIPDVLR